MTDQPQEPPPLLPSGPFCLRMVDGPNAGKSWPLTETVTTVGRTTGCLVRIDDAHVSRVQCELELDGNALILRNIGQRNPTCVNGVVREEAMLARGDIISFAGHTLIVDYAKPTERVQPMEATDPRTTQNFADAIHLRNEFDVAAYMNEPMLAGDLHRLLGLLRSLGRAESLEVLVANAIAHLGQRLGTEKIWIGWRLQDDADLVLFPPAPLEETRAAPFDIMHEACDGKLGVLASAYGPSRRQCAMAAPLVHGNTSFGAIAAFRSENRGGFSPRDLEYLVAVAECCAPLIRAVERLEQMGRDIQLDTAMQPLSIQMLGDSPAMAALHAELRRAAVARVHVILVGETGVGKDLAARMLHELSPHHSGPFIIANCAAIPVDLFESEMFGHEKGAFTGAMRRRKGLFELAHGGTLFLDEIGDLSLANQARLLRAVEAGAFRPVGAEKELKVDVRIVCATNRQLPDMQQVYFRADLYHRLAGVVVRVKPLREHRQDIAELADYFLMLTAPHAPAHPKEFTPDAIEKLTAYDWPGNIRELRNVVERACYMTGATRISKEDVHIEGATFTSDVRKDVASLDELEKQHLIQILREHHGKADKTAKALGLSRSTLYYKLARYEINPKDYRGASARVRRNLT